MTISKDYPEHPSILFLTGLMDSIDDQIKKDPGLMSSRMKNLLDDIIDLDCDLLVHTFHEPSMLLPESLKERVADVIQTARRLGVYPDWLTPKIPQKT
jgi:hypothetical protein